MKRKKKNHLRSASLFPEFKFRVVFFFFMGTLRHLPKKKEKCPSGSKRLNIFFSLLLPVRDSGISGTGIIYLLPSPFLPNVGTHPEALLGGGQQVSTAGKHVERKYSGIFSNRPRPRKVAPPAASNAPRGSSPARLISGVCTLKKIGNCTNSVIRAFCSKHFNRTLFNLHDVTN